MKRMMNKLAALIITLSMVICSVLGCGEGYFCRRYAGY